MESTNWGSPIFHSKNFDEVNAHLYEKYSIRRLSSSKSCVYVDDSPSFDANGKQIKLWKSYRCICGRTNDHKELCPVKYLYKYEENYGYQAFQSDAVHYESSSSSNSNCRKRKIFELPENVQNAVVSMVLTGSQPANIVNFMLNKPLDRQKKIFPEAIYKVIIV